MIEHETPKYEEEERQKTVPPLEAELPKEGTTEGVEVKEHSTTVAPKVIPSEEQTTAAPGSVEEAQTTPKSVDHTQATTVEGAKEAEEHTLSPVQVESSSQIPSEETLKETSSEIPSSSISAEEEQTTEVPSPEQPIEKHEEQQPSSPAAGEEQTTQPIRKEEETSVGIEKEIPTTVKPTDEQLADQKARKVAKLRDRWKKEQL